MNSSDAAESIVRMSLQGTDYALRITGSLAKNILVGLYVLSKEPKKTKGKTTLNKLLKTGKELKAFGIKEDDLQKFQKEAKKYGILFVVLKDKSDSNKMVDVMVKAEDASRVNRIIDRFKIFTYDEASIRSEINKTRAEKEAKDKGMKIKDIDDELIDEIFSKPIQKEENEMSNPNIAKTEKSPLSEHLSTNKKSTEVGTNSKISVREKIRLIRKELKAKEQDVNRQSNKELENSDTKKIEKNNETKHEQPKSKKRKEMVK